MVEVAGGGEGFVYVPLPEATHVIVAVSGVVSEYRTTVDAPLVSE